MWENGHHSGNNLKLPLMTLICRMSVNSHTWDPCWKVTLNNVSRVSLCLVCIIPLRVICWKTDMVGQNKLFSLMCRTCWIYLFLPNVLLNSCGSWMMSCWHMSGPWSHLGWVELNMVWYWLLWLCRVYRRIYVSSGRARVRVMKVTSNGFSLFSRVI